MDDKALIDDVSSLCKDCLYRFRRVFIPRNPEHFIDENGEALSADEENIVIMNLCIMSDMDLDIDSTVDCSHYQSKSEVDERDRISIFRHLHRD